MDKKTRVREKETRLKCLHPMLFLKVRGKCIFSSKCQFNLNGSEPRITFTFNVEILKMKQLSG